MAGQYDDMGKKGGESGPLDGLYRDNFVLGIILSVCCGIIGLALSLIAFFTAKDPTAKKNAQVCLIISAALTLLGCVIGVINMIVTMSAAGAGAGQFK
jgi:hypothetical protein